MKSGSSLVEVLVALAVLGLALPGIFAAGGLASRIIHFAAVDEGAVAVAELLLDSLLALDSVAPGDTRRQGYSAEWVVLEAGKLRLVQLSVQLADGRVPRPLSFEAYHATLPPRIPAR